MPDALCGYPQCCPMDTCATDSAGDLRAVCTCGDGCGCLCAGCACPAGYAFGGDEDGL